MYLGNSASLGKLEIVNGFNFIDGHDLDKCRRRAERECAHLHPDNMPELPIELRVFRIEPLPGDGPQYFDVNHKPVPHSDCIVITSRQTGEPQVYRAVTRRYPTVLDTDGWCWTRWHGEDRLRQAPPDDPYDEKPELPDGERLSWSEWRKLDWERDKIKSVWCDAVDTETERLALELDRDKKFTSGSYSVKSPDAEREYHEAIDRLSRTDGLLGELIDFATETAIKPKRGLSTLGAIAVIGSLVGRRVATPFCSGGTHVYGMGIDDTGGGKQHIINFIRQSLNFAGAPNLIGPGEVTGGPALMDWLAETPIGIAVMDEFGSFLSRINGANASGWEAQALKVFRELWGINFDCYAGMRWAKRKTDPIWAPAISVVGLSTPGQLWAGFKIENSEDGTLNRFVFVEEPDVYVESREPAIQLRDMPGGLQAQLRRLHDPDGTGRLPTDVMRGNFRPEPKPLEWGRGAKSRWLEYRKATELRVHDNKPLGMYLNRVAENALRLATIRAVGMGNPSVDVGDIDWGISFMQVTSDRMIAVGSERLGKEDTRDSKKFDALRKLIAAHPGGIKHSVVARKMLSNYSCKAKEMTELMKTLLEANEVAVSEDRNTYYPLKTQS